MKSQVGRMLALCDAAGNPDWSTEVEAAQGLRAPAKAFVAAHRPGLVRALWAHFEQTQDRCGCESVSHEKPGCNVRLIEKLLLESELD